MPHSPHGQPAVGRALLGKQAGDTVTIRLETSVRELTIAVIAYPKG